MFQRENLDLTGYISRTHSFKGEVVVQLDGYSAKEFKSLKEIFIEIEGTLVPFFPEKMHSMRADSERSSAVVKLEDVNDELHAGRLAGCDVYLPVRKKSKAKLEEESATGGEMAGFEVVDEVHGAIGSVVVLQNEGVNPLLQIDFNGTEILIPFRPEFIRNVDLDQKTILISAPEGLIEMYLGSDSASEGEAK